MGGGIHLSRELIGLTLFVARCHKPEADLDTCLAELTELYPQFDPETGRVQVEIAARATLSEATILDWEDGVPASLFTFGHMLPAGEGPDGEPISKFTGLADAERVLLLRNRLHDLFDEGGVKTVGNFVPVFGEAYVSTETWLLPEQPSDPENAVQCNDPMVHHGYLTAGALVGDDINGILAGQTMPTPPWAANDPFVDGAAVPPRVLLTAEHWCAYQAQGTMHLCDLLFEGGVDPLEWGLVQIWEGAQLPVAYEIPAESMSADAVAAIEQLHPGFVGAMVSGTIELIGYRDGATASVRSEPFDESVTVDLDFRVYSFRSEAQVLLVWEDGYTQENEMVQIDLSYPNRRWDVSMEVSLMLAEDVEGLAAGGALPFDEAVVAMVSRVDLDRRDEHYVAEQHPGGIVGAGTLEEIWLNPDGVALAESLADDQPLVLQADEVLAGNEIGLSEEGGFQPGDEEMVQDFQDLFAALGELDDAVGTLSQEDLLAAVLDNSTWEWSQTIGPFLGRYALDRNNRLGGDGQHENQVGYDGAGILGLSVAQTPETHEEFDTDQCKQFAGGNREQGVVFVLDGYDADFSPIATLDGRNVGHARWVVMDPQQLGALSSVAHLRDPASLGQGMYPANPVTSSDIATLMGNLVYAAADASIPSLDDLSCETRWAERDANERDACDQFCLDMQAQLSLTDEERGDCWTGCDAYFDAVEDAWYEQCVQPDYLMVQPFEGGAHACLSVRKAEGELDLGMPPVIHGEPRVFPYDVTQVWDGEPWPGGCAGACLPYPVPDLFEDFNQLEEVVYRPPVYLEERKNPDEILVHVPLGLTLEFDTEFTVQMNVGGSFPGLPDPSDTACPALPVADALYDEALADFQVAPDDTELALWLLTHFPAGGLPPELVDQHIETARYQFEQFEDGNEGDESTVQVLAGTAFLYVDLEWIFPVEMERHWEYGSRFWAANAHPVHVSELTGEGAFTSVELTMELDGFCFQLDPDASVFEGLMYGYDADFMRDYLEERIDPNDPCGNELAVYVSSSLEETSDILGELLAMEFVSPKSLDDAMEEQDEVGFQGLKTDVAIALAEFANLQLDVYSGLGLADVALVPPEYRALEHGGPFEMWLVEDVFDMANPSSTMLAPRWMVMDDWWRQGACESLGADGADCWGTLVAAQGSTVNRTTEYITHPDGSPTLEHYGSWPVSEGQAGWLFFEVAYDEDLPPDEATRFYPAPMTYTVDGFGDLEDANDSPWDIGFEALEEPALLPPWQPGRTGGP